MAHRRLAVSLVLALVVAVTASGAGGANGAGEFTFYPQAGILWRDLYPNNFVDLDPGPGLRDFACGTQTYDGHTGTDSDIRSFREMDIGVPVFAALDGRVISVQDGEFDRNHGQTTARFDNHVVLEHGSGRFTIYGHLRKGIRLKRNDRVVAGQHRWSVVLRRPSAVLVRTTRVTRAPSGSFELRRIVADLAGRDRISARATSPSGEICRATAAF